MKVRDILLLLLAVFLAVAVSFFTYNILRERETKVKASNVQVLVAKRDLAVGLKIERKDLSWKAWPENSLHPSYITKADKKKVFEAIVGSVVRFSIAKNEPVRDDKVIHAKDQSLFANVLSPGKRAFALNLGTQVRMTGPVLPGDFVDIIITDQPVRRGKVAEKTVVSRVQVIATDGLLFYRSGEKASPPKELSLEVTIDQAKRLSAALKEGKPSIGIYSLVNLKS